MRGTVLLGAGVAMMTAGAASSQGMGAQAPGAPYPQPGRQVVPGPSVNHPPLPPAPRVDQPVRPSRWGTQVGGRWWGGVNAPGGWAAYRQPARGDRLPRYWVAPRFYVNDWQGYGLPRPFAGYNWVRYYDDAVMIDRGGSVYDVRSGVNWDGAGNGADYASQGGRRADGVGGAVAGAVVGGVAGNVIAGRGNRLGGTLAGAGVGAAAGYALDRGRSDRAALPPPPPIDARDYGDVPIAPDGPPPPMRYDRREQREIVMHHDDRRGPPPPYAAGPSSWRSPDGRIAVTTTVSGGGAAPVIVTSGYAGGYAGGYGGGHGYHGGGYGYYGGGAVTTITVQSAPVVTTTTTEIIEDVVTWTRPVVRRAVRARTWHARPRPRPRCVCR